MDNQQEITIDLNMDNQQEINIDLVNMIRTVVDNQHDINSSISKIVQDIFKNQRRINLELIEIITSVGLILSDIGCDQENIEGLNWRIAQLEQIIAKQSKHSK